MLSRRTLLLSGLASLAGSRLALAVGAAEAAPRLITLGGDFTEIAFALGFGDAIVGRDSSSVYPEAVREAADVGYVRQLGAEGVLSLRPTLILASGSAGPPAVLDQIAATGVTVVRAPERYTPETLLHKIRLAANALGVADKGEALAADIEARLAETLAEVERLPGKPSALFILNARDGAPMAAGTGTAADAMIALAGASNVFDRHAGYKPISLEAAAAAAPEAIVMMEHTLEALGGVDGVTAHPALKLTPAAQKRRIIAVNAVYMLGFGPRLPEAIGDLARALRQGAA